MFFIWWKRKPRVELNNHRGNSNYADYNYIQQGKHWKMRENYSVWPETIYQNEDLHLQWGSAVKMFSTVVAPAEGEEHTKQWETTKLQ